MGPVVSFPLPAIHCRRDSVCAAHAPSSDRASKSATSFASPLCRCQPVFLVQDALASKSCAPSKAPLFLSQVVFLHHHRTDMASKRVAAGIWHCATEATN